jgi:nucleoside triphosphatase
VSTRWANSNQLSAITVMDSNLQPNNQHQPAVQFRVIVVGIVQNEFGEYLICKMPKGRGVFPDQWGLPGGGIEEGEMMEAALRRELREELGIEISDIKPLFFTDGQYRKSFPDGTQREVYMIFLIFSCKAISPELVLAPEFSDYAWVRQESLMSYELNSATIATFQQTAIIR